MKYKHPYPKLFGLDDDWHIRNLRKLLVATGEAFPLNPRQKGLLEEMATGTKREEETKFKRGDMVQLSEIDGPNMLVAEVGISSHMEAKLWVRCLWFNEQNELQTSTFEDDLLVHA